MPIALKMKPLTAAPASFLLLPGGRSRGRHPPFAARLYSPDSQSEPCPLGYCCKDDQHDSSSDRFCCFTLPVFVLQPNRSRLSRTFNNRIPKLCGHCMRPFLRLADPYTQPGIEHPKHLRPEPLQPHHPLNRKQSSHGT